MEIQTNLLPLSLRGINYYPRDTPWSGMWNGQTSVEVWSEELARAAHLRINTVRTFVEDWPIASSGAFEAHYLERLDIFLTEASRYGIRAVLCGKFHKWSEQAITSLIASYKNDGRILMWDIANEPNPPFDASIGNAINLIRQIDQNHFTTVGLQWHIEELAAAGGLPDVVQYHEYSRELMYQGPSRVSEVIASMRLHGENRPMIIGECGHSTSIVTEWEQALIYQFVLTACEAEQLVGVMPWTLLDFQPDLWDPVQRDYGIYRRDYSLKPAGIILSVMYSRWWKLVQLDRTFGYSKNARLIAEKHPTEAQDGHLNWAHGQDTAAVKREIATDIDRTLAALGGASKEQLDEIFGNMKNARLMSEEGVEQDQNGHQHWANLQNEAIVRQEIWKDADIIKKILNT